MARAMNTTTISKKPKNIDDIPAEILNDVFACVVVHCSPLTGERLAIKVSRDLCNIARIKLRASRACKKFQVMILMFFALNVFEIWQNIDRHLRDLHLLLHDKKHKTIEHGLELVESAWTLDHCYASRYKICLPPISRWEIVKEVVLRIGVPKNITMGRPSLPQREELVVKSPSWLFAIEQVAEGLLPNLDSLTIEIEAREMPMSAPAYGQKARENRELARVAMKEYVQAQVPKIGAKKVSIKYPEKWTW